MEENETCVTNLLPIRLDLARIIEALGESSHLHKRLPQAQVNIAKEHLKLAIQEIDSALETQSQHEQQI